MQTIRFVALVGAVIIAAGATLALAWGVAGEVMPYWQAAIGPLLLLTLILVRLRAARSGRKPTE